MAKIDHSLFSAHEHAIEEAYGACPKCSAKLAIKHGKSGAFIGCSAYPACDFTKPLHEFETSTLKVMDDSSCPECSAHLAIKKGRYGLYIGCTAFPDCHYIAKLSGSNESAPENGTAVTCPKCRTGRLREKTSKYGKRFYACDNYPKCKYLLNFLPVASTCPDCGWQALQQKTTAKGTILECPQKACNYSRPLE